MRLIQDDRTFYRVLFISMAICVLLYGEETLTFYRHGWSSPDNKPNANMRCKAVPGKPEDIECQVEVYGWERYRFIDHKDPVHYHVIPVERIE